MSKQTKKERRRIGDRFDGKLLRDLDGMHVITPLLYPNRCDNEAYISEKVDLTNIEKYLEKKNASEDVFKYTVFHVIVTALIKTITLRPKMNRFIQNKNTYQRNEVSASFVVKKLFSDNSEEGLAIIHAKDEDTIDTLHAQLFEQISSCKRTDVRDGSSEAMDILAHIPRPVTKAFVSVICWLDKHGHCPQSLIESDPYYTSVVLSNVGSIHLKSGYHHLVNWGTNSLFCLIGEFKEEEVEVEGRTETHKMVNLGITVDERLADGYYYSKSIRLCRKLLENPELLELPMNEPVDL